MLDVYVEVRVVRAAVSVLIQVDKLRGVSSAPDIERATGRAVCVFSGLRGDVSEVDKVQAGLPSDLYGAFQRGGRRGRYVREFTIWEEPRDVPGRIGAEFVADPGGGACEVVFAVVPTRYDVGNAFDVNPPLRFGALRDIQNTLC